MSQEDDELRQADLSHLTLKDMTPAQRREMRRRLEVFVEEIAGRAVPKPEVPKSKVRKWVPGMKR
jgi:hypothetical protein